MQTQKANWQQWISTVLVVLLCASFVFNIGDIRTQENEKVVIPTATEIASEINVTAADLTPILDKLNEDDDWENVATALAEDEYSRSSYKYIARILNDIDDKDDIERVIVKDVEVTSSNTEDEDATVIHTLKVYYEDTDGDDVKDYVIVETEIEDGEVEDQDINLE